MHLETLDLRRIYEERAIQNVINEIKVRIANCSLARNTTFYLEIDAEKRSRHKFPRQKLKDKVIGFIQVSNRICGLKIKGQQKKHFIMKQSIGKRENKDIIMMMGEHERKNVKTGNMQR